MLTFVSLLYLLCGALLLGMGLLVWLKRPDSALHRSFGLAALSLLLWLATLYVYQRLPQGSPLLLIGRANFATGPLTAWLAWRFMGELVAARRPAPSWPLLAALLLAGLSLFSPWIDAAESGAPGAHATTFGLLFPLYLLQVLASFGAAFLIARAGLLRGARRLRSQLAVVALGMAATLAVSLLTNVVLPYLMGDFSFSDAGPLSTVLFLAAVAYAISARQFFDIRLAVRKTVVFALLLAAVLALYAGLVLGLVQSLPIPAPSVRLLLQGIAIFLIAFGFDPLRSFLEEHTDRFLFRREFATRQALSALAVRLGETADLDQSMRLVLAALRQALHPHFVACLALDSDAESKHSVRRLHTLGVQASARLLPLAGEPILSSLASHSGLVTTEQLLAATSSQDRAAGQKLLARGVAAAVPLLAGERLTGIVLLGRRRSDLSYSGEAEALLEGMASQATAALEKARYFDADQTKGEFVSVAAHELLTPITAVQGFLSLILVEHMGRVDRQARSYLEKAYPALGQLLSLVKDLLSVSRLESGRIEVRTEPVDLGPLVHQVVEQLRPTAQAKHLYLRLEEPPASLPRAMADPGRLPEVITNLVGNAIKYTINGGVTVRLGAVAGDGPALRIEVADTGMGISVEGRRRLFTKFYRVATPQTAGIAGTGLGLYITRQLAERMGGTIGVKSQEGQGSTFWLSLSAATDAPTINPS